MTVYVVETIKDTLIQIGMTTNRAIAEKVARECGKEYFITEYHISENKFTEFD